MLTGFGIDGKIRSNMPAGYTVAMMANNSNGDLICAYYNDKGANLGSISADGKLDKTLAIGNLNGNIYAGRDGKVFATGDSSAKEYDLNTGDYRVIGQEDSGDGRLTVSVADLTYRKAVADNEKETVVYGCIAIEDNIKESIRKFNRQSDKYRIKVILHGSV